MWAALVETPGSSATDELSQYFFRVSPKMLVLSYSIDVAVYCVFSARAYISGDDSFFIKFLGLKIGSKIGSYIMGGLSGPIGPYGPYGRALMPRGSIGSSAPQPPRGPF